MPDGSGPPVFVIGNATADRRFLLTNPAGYSLTYNFAPDFDVRDFDVSPDGREIVLEQVEEQSDIVLLEVPRR